MNPYKHADDRAFWSRAVSRNYAPAAVYGGATPLVSHGEKVVSAGSCFAANIVPCLESAGFTYLRAESPHPGFAASTENFGYASFSAAYGNVYTPRQLLQLLRRCTGRFVPAEDRWEVPHGVIDPFRPGLRFHALSVPEFEVLTAQHLDATARAFREADVFIFTPGLTEAWVSLADGAVYPACPGTVAGEFDPAKHGFINFSTRELSEDLDNFVSEFRALNPRARIILTISPVPLVATASGNHVLEATLYSKSALRAAAGEVAQRHEHVAYFPAYEIVTGPQAPEDLFEPDRRNVSKRGIDTVMKAFLSRCSRPLAGPGRAAMPQLEDIAAMLSQQIVDAECEETMTDDALARPGNAGRKPFF